MKTSQERIFLFVAAISILQIMYYAPLMPMQMASHFDGGGLPNGWSPRTVFCGLYVGIVVLLFLSFRILPAMLSRFPDSMINLPNKKYWLATEQRAATFHMIKENLLFLGNGVLIFCLATFQLVFLANLTEGHRMNAGALWVLLVLLLIFVLSWTVRFIRSFRLPPEMVK